MKLLRCPHCGDVISITIHIIRSCICSKTAGIYLNDGLTALVTEGSTGSHCFSIQVITTTSKNRNGGYLKWKNVLVSIKTAMFAP